jgi:hypothetical protein
MNLILFLSTLAFGLACLLTALLIQRNRAASFAAARAQRRAQEQRLRYRVCADIRDGLDRLAANSGYPDDSMNQILLKATCEKIQKEALS